MGNESQMSCNYGQEKQKKKLPPRIHCDRTKIERAILIGVMGNSNYLWMNGIVEKKKKERRNYSLQRKHETT